VAGVHPLLLSLLLACGPKAPTPVATTDALQVDNTTATRLADLNLPGDPKLTAVGRDVVALRIDFAPSLAADAGLLDDALRVPCYTDACVADGLQRGDALAARLSALDWRTLSKHDQVNLRWMQVQLAELDHRLRVEQAWRRRPAEWLEPVANTFIALAAQSPERSDRGQAVAALLPAMLSEMQAHVSAPTRRDVETATGLLDGIDAALAQIPGSESARSAVADSRAWLHGLRDLPEFAVIGRDAYEWRLREAMLLPWDGDQLLALSEREAAAIEAELATLQAEPAPPPTPAEQAAAEGMDRDSFLGLYDRMVQTNLDLLRGMGKVSVPPDLAPMRARETPAALIPLTGDGGSMNPPPLFGPDQPGWWNVENYDSSWPLDRRMGLVIGMGRQATSGYGPYAVHEGVPGHHLQLARVRSNPDPLRTLLTDTATVEGWGLYAEQLFWEGGGFGTSQAARIRVLGSYRARVRRVTYDVNVERGTWTLQQAADWKHGTAAGAGQVDPDLLRTIQWPTQLISYFAGKQQLLSLRDEVRAKEGAEWDEQRFHDRVLDAGLIPLALIRCELLDLPVPGLE
jgi:Bacterial protein of unknown function (DUF885)